jgi:hypothetical protein
VIVTAGRDGVVKLWKWKPDLNSLQRSYSRWYCRIVEKIS